MIFNQRQCRFDPQVLACNESGSKQCLSQQKINVLKEAFAGPRGRKAEPIVGSWPYDAGISERGYTSWRIGDVDAKGNAQTMLPDMSDATLTQYFSYPAIPSVKYRPIDYAAMRRSIAPMASLNDPNGLDFRSFEARGGKLLIFTGWSDPVFTPLDLTQWYDRLRVADQTSGKATEIYARLFMVPGMNHCGGGPALDDFDPLTAMIDWVERGQAPASLIARGKAFPDQGRPLCAYPKTARYSGKGVTQDATSYICE